MSRMWTKKMSKGVNLEIFQQPPSMKSVANLIIAMERLKGGMSAAVQSTDFSDENLLTILLESVVEETFIIERTSAGPDSFSRGEEHPCSVTDSQKRSLVLVRNNLELLAVMLQGGSDSRKGKGEVEDKTSLSEISSESEMRRFLFYKQDTGLNISTLMSALFPDWYISTATQNNKPVEICQKNAARHITFSIQRQI
ncbi:hypothetical protein XENOCAPTIV_001183 [Xenoophorus captivus]|uniref:Interleukin-1 beta n=1 Tax=Xenoophorus captivus TaxID=1517983 RepID=A0ABV0R639_9TELE